ncbi:DUF4148 domain-containing protein [Massilia endophytica]|uniref:DUF4148 domain-containing protein n=1 Tax=Massilia endophytica TaxID=2899220 RepID=UPI001E425934|nr:DUF4148 domain-containing protein [Massilia endophytica]UGQ46280.1 DUF4148 domain-containing protein [Massilia endophytica]
MKASTLFAAAAFALSTGAFAQAPSPVKAPVNTTSGEAYQGDISFQSSRTRAEVKAELAAAQRSGQVDAGESYPSAPIASGPAKTRAQVQAEFEQAKAQGLIRHED